MVKGRAEATTNSGQHEQVAKLTAQGDFYEHSFGYLCTYSKHLQVFFRTVKVELDFFRMKGSKSSHFSVPNFVTSGGVFSVLKSVEMCAQYRVTNFLPGELSVQVHQKLQL